MADEPISLPEIASRNSVTVSPAAETAAGDDLATWLEAYFQLAVTTAESSRAVQRRDVGRFLSFMQDELGHSQRPAWTPRLSRAFVNALRATLNEDGSRRWSDPTINRILAHLKTFASWVHRQQPFPLGSPLANLAALSTPTVLALERALTLAEQRQLLDAADLLVEIGGRSRDRRAHGPSRANAPGAKATGPTATGRSSIPCSAPACAAPPSATSTSPPSTSTAGWSR